MEKEILELIEEKAGNYILRLAKTKAKTFRMTAYAGLRYFCDECTLSQVAKETGCTEGWVSKLTAKWERLLEQGDVNANLLQGAYRKRASSKAHSKRKKRDETGSPREVRVEPEDKMPSCRLGFVFTPEEELRMKTAIRESIRFFTIFGRGESPRKHGEYFSPYGCTRSEWLSQSKAATYCGCTEKYLSDAALRGLIERRTLKVCGGYVCYEYRCADLDRFIEDCGLS